MVPFASKRKMSRADIIWASQWRSGREYVCQRRRRKRHGFDSWVGKIPWGRKWQASPIFLPRKFHGQRSLAGYSPWGCKELDMTEQLKIHLCQRSQDGSLIPSYFTSVLSLKVKVKSLSCVRLFAIPWGPGSSVHGIF